jgi:hypothetical protein
VGVWGNHDYVICNLDKDHLREGVSPATYQRMQRVSTGTADPSLTFRRPRDRL